MTEYIYIRRRKARDAEAAALLAELRSALSIRKLEDLQLIRGMKLPV